MFRYIYMSYNEIPIPKGTIMLKTMAVRITKDNYSIAAACLAAGFATIPLRETLGCYLVINEMHAENFRKEGKHPYLVISNSWMTTKTFVDTYQFVDDMYDPEQFGEIIKL